MALNLYDRYLMPRLIDACCGLPAIQAHRARLLPLARGTVLEIGIGTGRNLPFYDGTRITTLHGLDPRIINEIELFESTLCFSTN